MESTYYSCQISINLGFPDRFSKKIRMKGKGTVRPRTGHEIQQIELDIALLFL